MERRYLNVFSAARAQTPKIRKKPFLKWEKLLKDWLTNTQNAQPNCDLRDLHRVVGANHGKVSAI
jgi:hypothetical protein